MIYLIAGLVLFLGSHSVEIFSPAFRGRHNKISQHPLYLQALKSGL